MSLILCATLALLNPGDDPQLLAVREAIEDEIEYGAEATINQDMDRYMEGVPDDYRILEDDGTVTDKAGLRAKQLQAWALIRRTNALTIEVEKVELGCDGHCATVVTDQRWDRQMLGRDGVTEFNVVTTQRHNETWEERSGRWIQTAIVELGGTTTVDGQPYD
jgi:hypothetical protein